MKIIFLMCCGDNKGLSLTSIKKGTLMILGTTS
nr:MAG TPA: hypothetical protein [Bacteriophage sp.]